MIDSHIHLNSREFYKNPEEVISSLEGNGVVAIINVATDLDSSKVSFDLANKYNPLVWATAGVHPESVVGQVDYSQIDKLKSFYKEDSVIAVGEVGLDKTYIKNSNDFDMYFKNQQDWLITQIDLAIEYNLPIVLHSRETTKEMLHILNGYKGKVTGVWHCFVEDVGVARQVLDMGFMISFTGIITYPNNSDLLEVVKFVPDDSYMLETDGPFLVPEPLRSKGVRPNMPWYVRDIARKVSEVRGENISKVVTDTTTNAQKLFGLHT